MFCIVDDAISFKTKPSSQDLLPNEDAYFHQSHLEGKQDYRHQTVVIMLSCNGIVLNYAIVLYYKYISNVDIVQANCPCHQWFLISFATAGIHAMTLWMLLSKGFIYH